MEIVLVHGGLHGGWCWERVLPHLRNAGFTVSAPDLPGMGEDDTPLVDVTLASTADFLADHVRARRRALLVGHSMAGPVLSECAERVPECLLGLVYLAANLVPSGMSMRDAAGVHLDGVMEGVHVTTDGVASTYEPETALRVFYNTTASDLAKAAISRLTPQSLQPTSSPLQLTEARFGSVPRAYIECLQDNAIPIAYQRHMHTALPCDPVITMDCDHSPFLCQPEKLAEHLGDIARRFSHEGAK